MVKLCRAGGEILQARIAPSCCIKPSKSSSANALQAASFEGDAVPKELDAPYSTADRTLTVCLYRILGFQEYGPGNNYLYLH